MSTGIYNKYPPGYDFNGAAVLNAGCGFMKYKAKNVVNLDAFDVCQPDVLHDLNKVPLPFKDEQFDMIVANHIMEHIPNWWECFNEFARILKPNGRCEIWVPESGSDAVNGFRDHVIEINHCSFYGTYGTYRGAGNAWSVANMKSNANRLKLIDSKMHHKDDWWILWSPAKLRLWYCEHLRNVAYEHGYTFRKVTIEEHNAEMNKLNERKRKCETLSMPQVL